MQGSCCTSHTLWQMLLALVHAPKLGHLCLLSSCAVVYGCTAGQLHLLWFPGSSEFPLLLLSLLLMSGALEVAYCFRSCVFTSCLMFPVSFAVSGWLRHYHIPLGCCLFPGSPSSFACYSCCHASGYFVFLCILLWTCAIVPSLSWSLSPCHLASATAMPGRYA